MSWFVKPVHVTFFCQSSSQQTRIKFTMCFKSSASVLSQATKAASIRCSWRLATQMCTSSSLGVFTVVGWSYVFTTWNTFCINVSGQVDSNGLADTGAGKLPSKHIIHVRVAIRRREDYDHGYIHLTVLRHLTVCQWSSVVSVIRNSARLALQARPPV